MSNVVELVTGMTNPKARAIEIGRTSDLLTDMVLMGATDAEIILVVHHYRVVLSGSAWYESRVVNDIDILREKYQSPNPQPVS